MVLQYVKGSSYSGSRTEAFVIGSTCLTGTDITLSKTSYNHNGKAIKPAPKVILGGKKLSSGAYYVVYRDNASPGTATVLVYGKGKYQGLAGEACFEIK